MMRTSVDRSRLAHLEARVEHGLKSFMDVGLALIEIRESHLYRDDFTSFGDYCAARWGISRARGYQLLGAAQTAEHLSTRVDTPPVNEGQVRALVSLPPEQQVKVWNAAVETAPRDKQGRPKVTKRHVERTIAATPASVPDLPAIAECPCGGQCPCHR